MITQSEVSKHNSDESCWVILYGNVYDVTDFLDNHPGGAQAILRFAGRDATEDFDLIHPPETLKDIESTHLGPVEPEEVSNHVADSEPTPKAEVSMYSLLNLNEIEEAATRVINKKAWAYYYSAADDKISKSLNTEAYRSILFRPRVFVDCRTCELGTMLLGNKVGLPIFISPTAMARLGHPAGEKGIAEGCKSFDCLQIIANNSSLSPEQIVADAPTTQVFGWQLYVQLNRKSSEDMLARINRLDQIKFVVLTLDAPVSGKREDDERINIQPHSAGSGIQTHEDALLAAQYTPLVKAIVLSNHGGRSLDTAPPAVHTLLEMRRYCPVVFDKLEVWVDGGIRRGTDAVKAMCLGAKAVGIGRPALWGLAAGGVEGVERTLQILSDEMKTCMRLLGTKTVEDLHPHLVNTSRLQRDIYGGTEYLDAGSTVVMKGKL
ncbi:hypothetical protein PENARI_c019G10393 [Penicillium arizonense]|uniref:Cytochrome b5 heme-binding domain-containing protein n=1 Tax=Penicillium arizonense TaxID=1835702 RepID=A0A1F5L9Q4_PENAI|nr:hypothetical protein PENARI_c019G10393 [Penicillium arizonense]OGE49935.1 hypothetical protein PENARI_c019G10393 [Penicillium arizonense]